MESDRSAASSARPTGELKIPACWSLLTRAPCNGNPVAIALDRLCDPDLNNRDDRMVRGMLEICQTRGLPMQGVDRAKWSPEWMTYASSSDVFEAAPPQPGASSSLSSTC